MENQESEFSMRCKSNGGSMGFSAMKTETYLNSPLRSCRTCAYRHKNWGSFDACVRSGFLCETTRIMSVLPEAQCDENFSGWRPLHYSSPKARRMMERLILELGADVDVFL